MVKSKEAEETLIISNHIKPAFGTYKLKVLTPAVYPYQFIKDNPMQYIKMPKFNTTPKDKDYYYKTI